MANLLKCHLYAKQRDQGTVTRDPSSIFTTYAKTEYWQVIFDGVVDFITASQAAGLPQAGYDYGGLIAGPVTPTRNADNPNVWLVQVNYQSRTPSTTTPALWNIQAQQGSQSVERPASTDRTAAFLVNVNGDPIPSLPTTRDILTTYSITWSANYVLPNWQNYLQARGQVNSDAIDLTICGFSLDYSARQVQLTDATCRCTRTQHVPIGAGTGSGSPPVTYTLGYDYTLTLLCYEDDANDTPLGNNTFQFRCPNEGWRRQAADVGGLTGFNILPGSSPAATDLTSTPAAPFLLAQDGTLLAPGATPLWLPDALNNGSPAAGAFQLEYQTTFNDLLSPLQDPSTGSGS